MTGRLRIGRSAAQALIIVFCCLGHLLYEFGGRLHLMFIGPGEAFLGRKAAAAFEALIGVHAAASAILTGEWSGAVLQRR